jgi:hypothetical protein
LDMVDKSTSLSKPTSGWMFVIGQPGQAFSSQSEAPSESCCWHFQQPPRGMILHPPLASMPDPPETFGNGQESTERSVHRRLVLPAAMAGVRCRYR